MSVIKPEIDDLALEGRLEVHAVHRLGSQRARQINDMIHGVRDQALLTMPARARSPSSPAPSRLSLALEEIASGDVSYERVKESYK